MVKLISHFFIKPDMSEEEARSAYGRVCGIAGIILNLLLFTGKIISGVLTGSISIIADAMNNLSDSGSAIVTFAGFRLAEEKPDPEHPFGHGRFEYIAGFIVSSLILVMAVELLKDSVTRILHPHKTSFSWLVILILGVTILVKLYMAFYNHVIGKKINSNTVLAAALDSVSDCIATSVVIISNIVAHFTGFIYLDSIAGIAVGLFILYEGLKSARETLDPLLGQSPDPEFVAKVRDIMRNEDKRITGIHDLIVHDYGPGRRIVSLHAEVPADGNIIELHDIIDNAERDLEEKLHCTATIHMDPIVTDDPRVLKLQTQVLSILQEISPALSMHDFRTVPGPTHTNLVFDVLMPFGFEESEDDLSRDIQDAVNREIGPEYFTVVHYDTDYSVRTVRK